MKQAGQYGFPSATVFYNEKDLFIRKTVEESLYISLSENLKGLNSAVKFIRVETPTLLTQDAVSKHREVGFELCDVGDLTLRAETTWGTLKSLDILWPDPKERKKNLPVCLWQSGKVYRWEQVRPFNELRFKEFYQIEFQLIVSESSKAPYFTSFVMNSTHFINRLCGTYQALEVDESQLAHYSSKTTDLMVGDIEVGAISIRNDLADQGMIVYEASFGLDRLCALQKLF